MKQDFQGTTEGEELEVSGAWTPQVVGTLGDAPFVFWRETKPRAPSFFPVLGTASSLPTLSGSNQHLWEGCHLGGIF